MVFLGIALFIVEFNNWLICLTNGPTFSGHKKFRTQGIPPGRDLNDSAVKRDQPTDTIDGFAAPVELELWADSG